MSGTVKLKLMMIGKSKCPRAFAGRANHLEVHYRNQQSAWMNKDLFMWWLTEAFYPEVARLYGDRPVLLLLDNAPPHRAGKLISILECYITV